MPVGRGGDTGEDSDATRFARALDALEQGESALLVVGEVPHDRYECVSQQLLGDAHAATPRRRLVVSDGPTADRRLSETGRATPEYARSVVRDSSRSAGEPDDSGQSHDAVDAAKVHRVGPSLIELGVIVTEVIEQFAASGGGLDAAELRVAFDCLPAMLERYDDEIAFRFLHIFANQVRAHDGMVHVHLPSSLDDRSVRLFEPLFDAVVELRVDGDELRQRWHFAERAFVSEWLTRPE